MLSFVLSNMISRLRIFFLKSVSKYERISRFSDRGLIEVNTSVNIY